MGDKEFKAVFADVTDFCIDDVQSAVDAINSAYPESEIQADIQDNQIRLKLVQLDVREYRKFLKSLQGLPGKLKDVLFETVDTIGSYGLKGKKRVFVNYNAERKVKDRKTKVVDRNRHYYANDNTFSKKNNQLPPEYENRIVCGDSHEVLSRLPDNCVDIIFTSPPYNFGLDYENHDDTSHWTKYFEKLFSIFREGIRVLKHGGRFVVNVQPLYSDYIPSHHIISNFFMENKMIWKGEIIWEKNNYNCKYCSWGSWKSPSSPYLKYTWEFIEVFCKGDLKKSGARGDIDINEEEFKQWVVAKWSIAPERKMKEFGHPAMFPEQLVERVLKLFSFQNDVVLDPFNGAGTTTVVADRLGRRYLGIDISQEYCDTAQRRIDESNVQVRLF